MERPSSSPSTRTEVICSKCGKATTVPFAPTPGRPVFCRDCFAQRGPPASSFGSAPAPRSGGGFRSGPPVRGAPTPKQRMMAQGRKGHFLYDAKAALEKHAGGMDDVNVRAFLEGLFARGTRQSTEAAQIFLEEKVKEGIVTHDQAIELGRLIDKYSFYR